MDAQSATKLREFPVPGYGILKWIKSMMPTRENDLIWRYIAISAISIVVTLLGAWATNSVNKTYLEERLNAQTAVINMRLDAIQATQRSKIDDIVELKLKVQRLETEMDELNGVTVARRKR